MSDVGIEVKIKLVSSIIPTEGERETYEMWLTGAVIEKNGSFYLRYEEVQEENMHIKTTIKLAQQKSFIMRNGAVDMRMPLNVTMDERGHYKSPYGDMPIVTKTHQLQVERNEKSGVFKTQYDLIIGGNSVGNYTLDITFTEV
jgi:uncharacterized beta-barrel protein YwiB (DUF1934 family)